MDGIGGWILDGIRGNLDVIGGQDPLLTLSGFTCLKPIMVYLTNAGEKEERWRKLEIDFYTCSVGR